MYFSSILLKEKFHDLRSLMVLSASELFLIKIKPQWSLTGVDLRPTAHQSGIDTTGL